MQMHQAPALQSGRTLAAMSRRLRPRARLLAPAAAALWLVACSSTAPPATGSRTPQPTARGAGTAPATASTTSGASSSSPPPSPATSVPAVSLSQCPARPAAAPQLAVLHRQGHPDDLAPDGAGGLWVTDTDAGTLYHLTAGGGVERTVNGLSSPEGIVPLANGDVLVAEQGSNRVLTVRPDGSTQAFTTLAAPPPGVEGVDGIGLDAPGMRVLIPDSAHGTMLIARSPGSGAAPAPTTQIASGLGRPVDAAIGPGGAIYVTAEDAAPRGLFRITATGGVGTVESLRQLDDIVVLDGLLYVTDLADGSVIAVDPGTGAQRTIATGFAQPQGLAALPGGRLAVADSPSGTIRALPAC